MDDESRIILLTVVNTINSVLGAAINLLVCIVIFKNEELQNGLDLLIGNLCLADLAVCLMAEPMYIGSLNGNLSTKGQLAFEALSVITMHAVAINLLVIAINRMMAIANPFKNTFIFSKVKILLLVSSVWVSSVCMSVFVLYTEEGQAFSPYSHIIIILAFLFSYLRIFWIAHKQQRKIDIQMESVGHNFKLVRLQRANRAAKTTALIVVSLMVCFFPDTVYDFMPSVDVMEKRREWLFTMLFASCSINPCIYMFRTQAFKVAMKRTLNMAA